MSESKPIYEFGAWALDTRDGLLRRNGESIPLTLKAFEILLVLIQNSNHLVEKAFFLEKVWPNTFVAESNLTQNIFRLRQVLGESETGSPYIETVPKRGYRFVADVREVVNGSTRQARESSARGRFDKHEETDEVLDQSIRSLAILPLDSVESNVDTQYLGDGITESIINCLSQLRQLRIMAWTTMARYRGKGEDIFKVGRDLGVQFGLTGKLLLRDNKLIIRVELVDIDSGWQLWGEQYNRDLSDILAVQEDISWEVSERLRLKLTGEERQRLAKRHTADPEAYQLYLKGRFLWNQRTVESLKSAITYIQKALEIDPNFALAYAGLADCYNQFTRFNLLKPREAFSKAKAAAMKALELNEALAEAQTSLAFVSMSYDWDWPAAERGFRIAIAQGPSYAPAHQWYAKYLSRMGRFVEALTEIERARELNPLSQVCLMTIGEILYFAREYDKAIKHCRETLELSPDFGQAYQVLSLAYAQKGMYEEAIDCCQARLDLFDADTEALAYLGCFHASMGHREKALGQLEALHLRSKQEYVPPSHMSIIYLGLGEHDQAIEYLEKAHADRSHFLTSLKVMPILDPIRSDRRFMDLLRRMDFSNGKQQQRLTTSVRG